jgi:hypothetical protein
MRRIFERRPGKHQRLIGNNAGAQQDNGQNAEKKHPNQRAAERTVAEQEMAHHSQYKKQAQGDNQRVVQRRYRRYPRWGEFHHRFRVSDPGPRRGY